MQDTQPPTPQLKTQAKLIINPEWGCVRNNLSRKPGSG
jgi:hypothetical protein